MRVQTLRLRDFKRFNDLTLDLTGRQSKIVALVGPNGSGKSSVFDAFEELGSNYKGRPGRSAGYYKKSIYDEVAGNQDYDPSQHITLVTDQQQLSRTSFYLRSAYRFTPRLAVQNIQRLGEVEQDANRPNQLIDVDNRLTNNYERLLGKFFDDVWGAELSGKAWSEQNVEGLNTVLAAILDISVSFLGNPVNGEGSLYFEKGHSKRFPYENLSAGEKEVIDLVLDLFVKKDIYTNSIIAIDEPELHINTAIQRKMLIELEKLVPEGSQLWVATHSIGFLRALREDLWDKTAVVDFTGSNFDGEVQLAPITGYRADWSKIFATALEDLTGLLAPKRVVYCEGRPDADPQGTEQGLDADVYNTVFGTTHSDTLFVSSGGGGEVQKNALLALRVLRKALIDVEFLVLKDRDTLSDADRAALLATEPDRRMLERREVENYLFDKEVLRAFCEASGRNFDEARYDVAVQDVRLQDLKLVQAEIKASCAAGGPMPTFKRDLATAITPDTAIYAELVGVILP